ncbi:ATP-binding protein [Lactobacillus sp. DCY120]|uniref:ATP-binding protein n=1 Tax=Bombilactobacillus apium TaxID=2675299 RepID=A0A850QWJ6_9LACO|nr:ATP-binding protein [Bombilactobacillus apium]NVY96174.1 ATP-binding protein [Bombilactobacillus apium]
MKVFSTNNIFITLLANIFQTGVFFYSFNLLYEFNNHLSKFRPLFFCMLSSIILTINTEINNNILIGLLTCISIYIITILFKMNGTSRMIVTIFSLFFAAITELISMFSCYYFFNVQLNHKPLFIIINSILQLIIIKSFFDSISIKNKLFSNYWYILLPISFISCILLSVTINNSHYNLLIKFCSICFVIILNILLLFQTNKIEKMFIETYSLKVQNQQLLSKSKKNTELINKFKSDRKIIHDYNKHLVLLKELIKRNNMDGALKKINEQLELPTVHQSNSSFTGNLAIDSMNSYLVDNCRKYKIQLSKSIRVNSHLIGIQSDSLGLIIGNIYDNAIKYSKSNLTNRFIRNEIVIEKDRLILRITNGFNYAHIYRQLKGYGVGLSISKDLIKDLNGIIEIKRLKNTYTVLVVIPYKA